jgi:hypothetical protein
MPKFASNQSFLRSQAFWSVVAKFPLLALPALFGQLLRNFRRPFILLFLARGRLPIHLARIYSAFLELWVGFALFLGIRLLEFSLF